jgi:hypothetical protein
MYRSRVDQSKLKKSTGVLAVLRRMYSPAVDLSGLKKRTGAMTVLRGIYSALHITQSKGGSLRAKEKNRCHDCSERNVQCTAHNTSKGWIY